ncbi:CaiB/BaiF CoA-transferase family protein [Pseudofrankia sp. BMG5.37]|uniref:CaiB/BaiF CoA transferase family protein n=1 Tax=Pseudofrankia sp. BMG5.37 TaxID=3050035 RepID=UPI002895956C|nr:CaiB/BaiF CoA-transferase family protein [Pseudofrankia sp. BMG5.37]MDT3441897.1 CaiB/BaiF CoA-transferase family protein [Pseudofrankia sp. BMG5.37]
MIRLLEGVRVLESAQLLNGGTLGMFLGDLGADVVKIEAPPNGDYLRHFLGQIAPGYSVPHLQVNKNKRSVALDVRAEAGREVFWRLVEGAEIFVDGNRPGVLDRLGIGYEAMRTHNPRIVYVSCTAFGANGPYARIPAHGMMMGAIAGSHLRARGDDGLLHRQEPTGTGTELAGEATVIAAMQAALYACAALVRARATGEGANIDVAACDAAVLSAYFPVDLALNDARITDRAGMPDMVGGEMTGARYNFYETRDGHVVLLAAIEPRFWRNFCQAVGREDLLAEASPTDGGAVDFGTPELRHRLAEVFLTRDLADWVALAAAHDITLGPANQGVAEMAADPNIRGRQILVDTEHPVAGPFTCVGSPAVIAGQPYEVRIPAPAAGEHTRQVLREAGLSDPEIDQLRDQGLVTEAGPLTGATAARRG